MEWSELLKPNVLVFLVGGSIAIVAILSGYFNSKAKIRANQELKAQMIARGMSADEIERVLRAGEVPAEE